MSSLAEFSGVPVIDVAPLVAAAAESNIAEAQVASQLGGACRESGFFYVVGHGIDPALLGRLDQLSRRFFQLPLEEKQKIAMSRGGRAWRGYFAVGDELTSGKPDQKEGLYFGAELPSNHPEVAAGTPLHGANLFPELPGFREVVLDYLAAMTRLGHSLMAGLSLSLGLPRGYFDGHYTADPLVLFRIFNYPAPRPPAGTPLADQPQWGVGEHTDYGLLTMLWQDDAGGLQVKSRSRWIDAPPIPGSFICNIGDMLDRLTRGLYRSTPHRVLNTAGRDRLSFPFFFDPNFNAEVRPIEELANLEIPDDRNQRWDKASVHETIGTYGDYLLNKVSKVFPQLKREVLQQMGIDAVELVMAVEERFGITIRTDETARISTVRDLTEIVLSRIQARAHSPCPTMHAFLKIRADLRHVLGDAGLRVRPSQRIADIIPAGRRRAYWRTLAHQMGAHPPSLERPRIIKIGLIVVSIVLFLLATTFAAVDIAMLPLALALAAFLSLALVLITLPLCTIPPDSLSTFGDVARKLAGATVAMSSSISPNPTAWVPEVLRDIIAKQLEVDRNLVIPSATFVHDLGMD